MAGSGGLVLISEVENMIFWLFRCGFPEPVCYQVIKAINMNISTPNAIAATTKIINLNFTALNLTSSFRCGFP